MTKSEVSDSGRKAINEVIEIITKIEMSERGRERVIDMSSRHSLRLVLMEYKITGLSK